MLIEYTKSKCSSGYASVVAFPTRSRSFTSSFAFAIAYSDASSPVYLNPRHDLREIVEEKPLPQPTSRILSPAFNE